MRSLPEWIGKSNDAPIPPRVRLRQFDHDNGICQCGCGIKIRPGDKWQTDHIVALVNGGENRESNLRTMLTDHHKAKTAADVAEKAKTYERRAKHLGIKRSKTPIRGWRRFDGSVVFNPKARTEQRRGR